MLALLLIATVFVGFVAAFSIVALIWTRRQQRKQTLEVLHAGPARDEAAEATLLREDLRDWSETWRWWAPLLSVRDAMAQQLRQADLGWSVPRFLMLSLLCGVAGSAAGLIIARQVALPAVVITGTAGAASPFLYVRRARTRRTRRIEEQFPDALDFLSRAMRAGHAFSVSLEMLADETPDPMGGEFRKLYHEQNLGAPIDVALQALADRCGLMDVQFFVSAVLLQKETGGNLTEILTSLSFTIRERLRLKGQVRAASAHGRVTGMVLTGMPLMLMAGLMMISPGYLTGLANDAHGRYMIIGAIAGQLIGYMCIRRITDIQV